MYKKSIQELEKDLLQDQQSYENDELSNAEFERAETIITKQIDAEKLRIAKVNTDAVVHNLYLNKKISQQARSRTIIAISNAKSIEEIENIEFEPED